MREQTKYYLWLPWAVATAIAVSILFIIYNFGSFTVNLSALAPWDTAQSVETVRAISEFNGETDTSAYWQRRLIAFSVLVLLFVIGPSLWIWSEANQNKKEHLKKGLSWYIGVILVIIGLVNAIPATAVKGYIFQKTWASAEKSQNMDKLRTDMVNLAFDLTEYYYLSGKTGVNTAELLTSIKLNELKNYPVDSNNSYVIRPSDSTVTLYGIGYSEGIDSEFENINGERGRVQLALELDPRADQIRWSKQNTR